MNQRLVLIFSLFVFVTCSDFKFESCILRSRSDTVIIDLSEPLEDDDWVSVGPTMPNVTYYFSLCPEGRSKCPGNSFFCLNFQNGTILDLGSSYIGTSEVVVDGVSSYNMSLNSKNGRGHVNVQCDHDSRMDPVLSSINQDPKGGPPFYEYIITWLSSANCPLKHFSVRNNCILYTHPRSYDLRPLRRAHHVSAGGKDYIINICEVLSPNCSSYVCGVTKGNLPKPLSNVFELSYVEHKGLSINYQTLTGQKIIVKLVCSLEREDYKLNPVSNNKDDLIFSIKTPLVCDFPAINCLLRAPHKNIAYDLNELNKIIDNYQWKLNNGRRLLLNVCGPLNYIPQVPCADGATNAGCIVDRNNRTEATFSFANVTVFRPGHIAMVYNSTDPQKSGLSLYINFKCSRDISVSPTILERVININIDWNTYAACPLKYSTGNNCEVENLYNDSKVNLMPLYKKTSDHFIQNGKESFRINMCGVLTQSCSKNTNAAVCFKNSNGTELAIGETGALEPIFVDGQFIFKLEGEPCHNNATKSRVKIIMGCEFPSNTTSNYHPQLFPSSKENECIYYFYWKNPLVCGSSVSSNCTFSKDHVKYDLSSLINLRENYIINFKDSEIELNVCHSLIPGHRIHCHQLSGACLKNHSISSLLSNAYDNHENNENLWLGLASDQDDFEIIDNKIRLHYRNGGICRSSNVENLYSTIIDFICKKTAYDTEPELVSIKDCDYHFSWTTSAACPTYTSTTPCSINVLNKTFDFSKFMDKTFQVEIENSTEPLNYEITIGICGPVDTIGCSDKSGSCLFEDRVTKNLGNYNSKLRYANDSLRLVYEAVDCKSTMIQFNCGPYESSKPYLIKRNNCSTIISWSTRLACHDDYESNKMKCCQDIEDLCENLNQTYVVGINGKEVAFINICKPLLPKRGIMCPSGSVSCLANNESFDSFSSEKSLGSFMLPPVLSNDKTAILKYSNGSICHEDPKKRYSTSIMFICDENAHIGRPVLVNISDHCLYEFRWATSLMCHEKCSLPIGDKNKDVLHQFQNWDKTILSKNGLDKSPYILNLCQVSERCGSHICKLDGTSKWLSFTDPNSYKSLKVSDFKTTVFYEYISSNISKDSCGAQVDLICDSNDRGPGRPRLEEERDCFIYVVWKTSLACFAEKSSESSSNIAAWCFFSIALLVFAVIVAVIIRYNGQLNLESCWNRTLGYRRSDVDTELKALTFEEGIEEEKMLIMKIR